LTEMFMSMFNRKEFAEKSRELEFEEKKPIQVECPIRYSRSSLINVITLGLTKSVIIYRIIIRTNYIYLLMFSKWILEM